MFWKAPVKKDFAKLKEKTWQKQKVTILHRIFSSFPKRFIIAVFKSKYGHEIIKTLNVFESCKPKIWWCNTYGTFSECFLKLVKGWRHEVKRNSKIKVHGICLWYLISTCYKVPYWEKFCLGKMASSSLFPVENLPRRKLPPMKFFPDEKLYLPNTFF